MFDSSADSENIITQPAREFDDIKSESLNVKQLLPSLNRGDRRNNASKFIRYLKIAVEAVSFFDGKNIPLNYFIEGCEKAKSMLLEAESQFTKIIRTRIMSEAVVLYKIRTCAVQLIFKTSLWRFKKYISAARRVGSYLSKE